MITNKISKEPEVGDDGRIMAEFEKRRYSLNRQRAIHNKLQCSARNGIEIEETGGGIKIAFSPGMYELVKNVIQDFYTKNCKDYSYTHIPVIDKKGDLVEVKYKISKGKSYLYTLNMYNTKCSCLINGKQPHQFTETDLPSMLNKLEEQLSLCGITVEDVNTNVVNLLQRCQQDLIQSRSTKASVTPISNTQENLTTFQQRENNLTEFSVEGLPEDEGEQTTIEMNHSKDEESAITDVLLFIKNDIGEIKKELKSHIDTTNSQFNRIQDELFNIKKIISVNDKDILNNMEILTTSSDNVKSEMQKTSEVVQRRLTGIFDSLKSLHNKRTINDKITTCDDDSVQIINSPKSAQSTNRKIEIDRPTCKPVNKFNYATTDNTCINKENLPRNNSAANKTTVETSHKKTLLMGSSIFKGINKKGLHTDVIVDTNSGAGTQRILTKLKTLNVSEYQNIVIYIGGNDISSKMPEEQCSTNLQRIIEYINAYQGCTLYLCTLCPRKDADIVPMNDYIKQLCEIHGLHAINVYSSFVYENGNTVNGQYVRDGIHLNRTGSSVLVRTINEHVKIIKPQNTSSPRNNERSYTKDNAHQEPQPYYNDWTYPSNQWSQRPQNHQQPHQRNNNFFNGRNLNRYNDRRTDNWNNLGASHYHRW